MHDDQFVLGRLDKYFDMLNNENNSDDHMQRQDELISFQLANVILYTPHPPPPQSFKKVPGCDKCQVAGTSPAYIMTSENPR